MKDIVLHDSSEINYKRMTIPSWTIYSKGTIEYPGRFVARLFDLSEPLHFVITGDTVQSIRDKFPDFMCCIGRDPEDSPVILETWI